MKPRVLVGRRLPGGALDRLRRIADVDVWEGDLPAPPDTFAERAVSAIGLITLLTDRVDSALLDRCPEVRVVANFAVGYDNFDLAELTRRGIPASNTPGVLTEATADLTFGLLLATSRKIVAGRDAVRAGKWKTWEPSGWLGLELSGATLGIIGMGQIGRAVARRAASFQMHVLGSDVRPFDVPGVEHVELPELLARSDIVTLHCELTPQSRHLIGEDQLHQMKPSAILINASRGPIVDQRALAAALREGTIAAAGLDVTDPEPIAPDDELLALENCLVVPHIGSATLHTRSRMADIAVDNMIAGLNGERLPNCLNPEVYATR
ncbi:MAG: D-glycerate dehydrogenase [Acidimicrobiales bacterium]